MKSNHTHWIARCLLCAVTLVFCLLLALTLSGVFDPEPGIGFISTDAVHLAVDDTILEAKALELDVPFLRDTESGALGERSRTLTEQGSQVLVIDLNRPLTSTEQDDLRTLTAQGITLLFAGYDPGQSFLQSCNDLAWYVGCDSAQAGEILGAELAQLYREGVLADLNHDNLLQYVWMADSVTAAKDSLLHYTLEECEHYGVYSVRTGWVDGSADTLTEKLTDLLSTAAPLSPETADGETSAPAPTTDSRNAPSEVVLCSSADAIYSALEARTAAGRPDLPVIGFAANAQQAQELAQAGAVALSVYDREGVSQCLAQLAQAALARQALTDTGFIPTGHVFLQPFFPYEF